MKIVFRTLLLVTVLSSAFAKNTTAQIFLEDFGIVGGGAYVTANTTLINDCFDGDTADYFGVLLATEINQTYVGGSGAFLAGQDMNGAPCSVGSGGADIVGINVSGETGLVICFDIAEGDSSDGNEDWEASSLVTVSADVDGAGLVELFAVTGGGANNTEPGVDCDGDAIADGAVITNVFTTYCLPVGVVGALLDINISIQGLRSIDEDVAIDNVAVYSDASPAPNSNIGCVICEAQVTGEMPICDVGDTTYSTTFSFTGGATDNYVVTSSAGTVVLINNPSVDVMGDIDITGIPVGTDVVLSLTSTDVCNVQLSVSSPTCSGPLCSGDLYIAGVIDGPLAGGVPKGMQLCATADIPNLSLYGIESVSNGNGSGGAEEYTFPADAISSGDCIWISDDNIGLAQYLGFPTCYESGVLRVNGDDALILYCNGIVSDVFGDADVDGTGQTWEYLDGWAFSSDTSPSPVFNDADWSYSGANAIDGCAANVTCESVYPSTDNFCSAPACGSLTYTAVAQCADQLGANANENEYFILVEITDIGRSPILQIDDGTTVITGITSPSILTLGPYEHSGRGNQIVSIVISDELTGFCSDSTEVLETLCWDGDADGILGDIGTACNCGVVPPGAAFAQAAPGTFISGGSSAKIQFYVLVDQTTGLVSADAAGITFNFTGLFSGVGNGTFDIYPVNVDESDFSALTSGIVAGTDWQTYISGFSVCNGLCDPETVLVQCSCCPTIAAITVGGTACDGDPFDISAEGLTKMSQAFNIDQDYGIEFVYYNAGTAADPYIGGTSLGTVPYNSLTNMDAEAILTGATINAMGGGMFDIFAILSPIPSDPTCRPSVAVPFTVSDPSVTLDLDLKVCVTNGNTNFVGDPTGAADFTLSPIEGQCPTCLNDEGVFSISPAGPYFTDSGSGISFSFDASLAGEGSYVLTYTYTDDFGCLNSATGDITVLESVEIVSSAPAMLCTAITSFDLIDFVDTPGGVFAGPAILNSLQGTFNPAAEGTGIYNFVYRPNDPSICADPILIQIEVIEDCVQTEVPTVSEWGLICLAMSLLSFIAIYVRRKNEVAIAT